jgi:hypothetical protein
MATFTAIDQDVWGYRTRMVDPTAVLDRLETEVREGIAAFRILSINHQLCDDALGYERVSVELGVSQELFDGFLNGNAGYRAQYAQGVPQGEAFNRAALDAVIGMLVESERLFAPKVDAELCRKSLEGRYAKFWFPKSLTDPSSQEQLLKLPELIKWPQWVAHWSSKEQPRKGLLAPSLDEPSILLNGSFVRRGDWAIYEQKPERSEDLTKRGWT